MNGLTTTLLIFSYWYIVICKFVDYFGRVQFLILLVPGIGRVV